MAETNPPLTTEPPTDITDPLPPQPFPGDWKDDDGQAIDDYFEAGDNSPLEFDEVKSNKTEIPEVTRIVHNEFSLPGGAGRDSIRLFPADPYRKSLHFYSAFSFFWSDQPINNPTGSPFPAPVVNGVFYTAQMGIVDLIGHTGPVYVCASEVALSIQAWAVTK